MTTEPFIESSEELFTPGQLVECMDDQFSAEALINIETLPKKGEIYTIREAAVCRNHTTGQFNQSIRFEEIVNPGMLGNVAEPFWPASRFRILAPDTQSLDVTNSPRADRCDDSITPEIFNEHAAQCPGFQELRNSSPGLAACIMWLEDWSTTRINDLPKVLKFLAEQKRRSLCLRYGFPASRGILKLFKNWEMNRKVGVERIASHTCLLETLKLLSIEPNAHELLCRSPEPWLGDVQRMLYGMISGPFGYFPRSKMKEGKLDWFFTLPTLRRHYLTESMDLLLVRGRFDECFLPRLLHLASFASEKKAVAYVQHRKFLQDHINSWIVDMWATNDARNYWPLPPIPGDDFLHAISSKAEIDAEGDEMDHCIANHTTHIVMGTYFAYRMTQPLRCTVGLAFSNGRWVVDEIRGKNNALPESPEVETLVKNWIKAQASMIPPQSERVPAQTVIRESLRNLKGHKVKS